MPQMIDGMTLYHGSYCEVNKPLLEKCAKSKDFGRGFYLTSSKEQAVRFLNTSIAKALSTGDILQSQDYGYISKYRFSKNPELNVKIFETADRDWLHCIVAHRKDNTFISIEREMKQFDIVGGKIADDATNATIVAYMADAFGEIGSEEADDFCIKRLLPDKLKDQFSFRTEVALRCLEFLGSEKIWIKK